jgi:hypothetical protein
MSIMKRGGWILVGVVIGALAASSSRGVTAQSQDGTRLKLTTTSAGIGQAIFIKDTKSTGCWFVVSQPNAGVGIATAPPEACE